MDAIMNFFKPKNNAAGNNIPPRVNNRRNNKPKNNQAIGNVAPVVNNIPNSVAPETPTNYGGGRRRRHRKGSRSAHRKGSRSAHRKTKKSKKTSRRTRR